MRKKSPSDMNRQTEAPADGQHMQVHCITYLRTLQTFFGVKPLAAMPYILWLVQ